MTTIKNSAPTATIEGLGQGGFSGRLVQVLGSFFDLLLEWQDRAAQRAHLAALDDHALRDVGLSRADVQMEVDKPFWRL
jgi:uncharacterized protein YjiS (DUF1127 family)